MLTYKKAGVPHLKSDPAYKKWITGLIDSTRVPGVFGDSFDFAASYDLKELRMRDPILIYSTDGVGTKLKLAHLLNKHDTIGFDLVAMCVNDIITKGARPVLFVDYLGTPERDQKIENEVLKSIAMACREAGCALVGGETAYMRGFYANSTKYELVGSAIGFVERTQLINGKDKIKKGDALLGLVSSGFHSNGFSLLQQPEIFSEQELKNGIGLELLTPTRIYVKPVLSILDEIDIHGMANITGDGFYGNLLRLLPEDLGASIDSTAWKPPKLFEEVRKRANIPPLKENGTEMYHTFNMGIGLVLALDKKYLDTAQKILTRFKISSWEIGEIAKGKGVEIR